MNDTEVWKEIPGWEGYYSASTLGRIRSENRTITRTTGINEYHKGVILKPWIAKSAGGYFIVGLCMDNNRYKMAVHRLVMWTFVGSQQKGMDVRHLDGNCTNNRLDNLVYGTRSENIKDAVKHGTMRRPVKLTKDDVIDICSMGRNKISSKVVAAKYNINRNTITEIWRGEIWDHVTQGLLPESNQNIKYNKISEEHRAIIKNNTIKIMKAAKLVGIDRHTAARWRKRFNNL